jgi:hypothetical protein
MSLRAAIALAAALLPAPAVPLLAAPGGGGGSPGGGDGGATLRDSGSNVSGDVPAAQRAASAAVQVDGRVVDGAGRPLGGIAVKVFADGVLTGSATTAADGFFALVTNPMESGKGSAVVWFQSPDPEAYVDSWIVLWVSDSAKQSGLFPPCTERVAGSRGTREVEITLRSADERRKVVVESKCLEGA